MIKDMMKRAGLTYRKLSELSGVPERTLQHWKLKGIDHASVGQAIKVARALGTSVEELAGEEVTDER